ncbi:MAG: hypothetical protein AAFX93_04485 [Verrucomicrobiota bacterium]
MANLFRYTAPQICVISVTGEDALSYLQSQFSNDLKSSGDQPVTYGLFLNRKGKVQADAFIIRTGDESFYLVSYFCDPAQVLETVEANVIADEVEFEDVSASFQLITYWGDEAWINQRLPAAGAYNHQAKAYIFRGRRMNKIHFECLVSRDSNDPFAEDTATEADVHAMLQLRIDAGIPAIPQDIGTDDLPHEGADLSSAAVSYTKGCYLGQEVMARLHAMGRPQRALFLVEFPQPTNDKVSVYAGEKAIGSITSQCSKNEQTALGLAVLKRRYVTEDTQLTLGNSGDRTVKIVAETPTHDA